MRAGGRRASGAVAACVLLLLASFADSAAGLDAAQRRGRRIYREGIGTGPIEVRLASGVRLPGSRFPCIACHMEDGTGTLEGGVRSADITWQVLSKEFGGVRPSGRAHPPYDEQALIRAVTQGRDPAGNALHEVHPRYTMGASDLADLAAYLKVLGTEPVPGVGDNEIRIGILLPSSGPLAAAGAEVRAMLSAYFRELNARGGLFRRTVSLVPFPFDPSDGGGAAAAARAAVEADAVLAFLGNVGGAPGDEAARLLAEARVPVIAPLYSVPHSGYGADRYTFHIPASVSDQARVAVDFLALELPRPASRMALVHARDPSGEAGAAGAREQAARHSVAVADVVAFVPGTFSPAETVRRLREKEPDAVLFFGAGRDFAALVAEAERQGWRPVFAAPAAMVGGTMSAAPRGAAARIYLVSPLDVPESSAEFARFAEMGRRHGVPGEHRAFQVVAYAGAKLLEEGLRRAGRAVTREKFVKALGGLYEFRTGVTPPVSYDDNRRSGTRGAAILAPGPGGGLVPVFPWREPK